MALVLFLLFLAMPILELYVIVQVAGWVGVVETLALLVLVSIVGTWLVRREGLGALRRVQGQLAAGDLPTTGLLDGALIVLAGALMVTPGFVTDAFGLLLLVPPTRAVVRAGIVRRFRHRFESGVLGGAAAEGRPATWVWSSSTGSGRVDVGEAWIVTDARDQPPPSDPELGGGR
jgi:UPF0716 protein FxsA